MFGLGEEQVGKFGFDVQLSQELDVQVTAQGEQVQWKDNTLIVAPPRHPGFDLLLCLRGEEGHPVYLYEDVKVHTPGAPQVGAAAETPTVDQIVAQTIAYKLLLTLKDHVQRCNLSSKTVEQQLVEMNNVLFVLSVYGATWQRDQEAVLHALKEIDVTKDLAIGFVEKHWHQVAFQGTDEIKANSLAVVLPIAQLVEAVL